MQDSDRRDLPGSCHGDHDLRAIDAPKIQYTQNPMHPKPHPPANKKGAAFATPEDSGL